MCVCVCVCVCFLCVCVRLCVCVSLSLSLSLICLLLYFLAICERRSFYLSPSLCIYIYIYIYTIYIYIYTYIQRQGERESSWETNILQRKGQKKREAFSQVCLRSTFSYLQRFSLCHKGKRMGQPITIEHLNKDLLIYFTKHLTKVRCPDINVHVHA